jgi:hypothetical protein
MLAHRNAENMRADRDAVYSLVPAVEDGVLSRIQVGCALPLVSPSYGPVCRSFRLRNARCWYWPACLARTATWRPSPAVCARRGSCRSGKTLGRECAVTSGP